MWLVVFNLYLLFTLGSTSIIDIIRSNIKTQNKLYECQITHKHYLLTSMKDEFSNYNNTQLMKMYVDYLNKYTFIKLNNTCILISKTPSFKHEIEDNCNKGNLSSLIEFKDSNQISQITKYVTSITNNTIAYMIGKNKTNDKLLIVKNSTYRIEYLHNNFEGFSSHYICSFDLNNCNNNNKCGDKGHCYFNPLNNSFSCNCYFFYTGQYCDNFSSQGFQIFYTLTIIGVIGLITIIVYIVIYCKTPSSIKYRSNPNLLSHIRYLIKYKSYNIIISILGIMMGVLILCIENFDIDKINILNKYNTMVCKYKNNIMKDYLFGTISLILSIIFYVINFINSKIKHTKTKCIIPLNLYSKENRYKKVIIFLSYMFIIIHLLILSLFDLSEYMFKSVTTINSTSIIDTHINPILDKQITLFNSGILYQLLIKVLYTISILLHFYPLLLSVELKMRSIMISVLSMLYSYIILSYYITLNICNEKNELYNILKNKILNSISKISSIGKIDLVFPSLILSKFNNTIFRNGSNITSEISVNKINNIEYLFIYIALCIMCIYFTFDTLYEMYYKLHICLSRRYHISLPLIHTENILENEYCYVKELLNIKHKKTNTILEKIYKNKSYYRFPLIIILTQFIVIMILYLISVIIFTKSIHIIDFMYGLFILIIRLIFKNKIELEIDVMSLKRIILESCFITIIIILVQMFIFIRGYQTNILNAYKGKYKPLSKKLSYNTLLKYSLGFIIHSIGNTLIAYFILLINSFVFVIIIRILYHVSWLRNRIIEIIAPIVIIYLFIKLIIWLLSKRLNNNNIYNILALFKLFFGLPIALFLSVIKIQWSLLFMCINKCRLDYSNYGEQMIEHDAGYMSYISTILVESRKTNPIALVFVDILQKSIKNKIKVVCVNEVNTQVI